MLKINKKLAALTIVGVGAISSLTGCKKQTVDNNSKKASETNNIETTTELTTEQVSVTTIYNELNVNDNASIEARVDKIYDSYTDFFVESGMSKDHIRNMIFVINDKYTDENGNLLIDENSLREAYINIERVMLPYKVSQKIDNINTINNPELPEIEDGIIIPTIPRLSEFVDLSIPGAEITVREVAEWEDELAYQVNLMNTTGNYDVESINAFVKKNEVADYNNDVTGLSGATTVTGYLFLLSDQHKYALRMCGAMQADGRNFIEGNEGIEDIKVNAFNEERKTEDLVENMKEEGLINSETVDTIVEYTYNEELNNHIITPEEIMESYGLTYEQSELLVNYAIYLSTMDFYKYERIDCNKKREMQDKLNNIMKNNITGKAIYTLHI